MTDAAPPPEQAAGIPWTVRVADWSARHRWPVFVLWFVATIGLFAGSLLAGGTNSAEAVSNDDRAKYEAAEAFIVWNEANAGAQSEEKASAQFLLVVTNSDGTIDDAAYRDAISDMSQRLNELTATVGGESGPVFEQLVDPTEAPPEAGLISPDKSTVRIAARVPGDGEVLVERLKPVPALVDELKADYPNLGIYPLNNTLTNDEIQELINGGLDDSLKLTIPLTFLILLIAFGAVIAAVVPLVLATTALLAAFGILGLYSQYVSAVSPYATQLVVLIGLAVAVDYSLFMLTRFRTERRHGRPKLSAIHVASNTAGRAVFFSGLAVAISIGGLFLLDDPLFRSMAIGTIAVVLVAVIGSLTFLPATLAILGDGVNRLRLPFLGRDREEGSGVWAALVKAVMRQPVIAFVVAGAFLIVLATPVLRLRMGQTDFTSFPDSLDGVQAVNLLNEKWPSGGTLELDVVVTQADQAATKSAIDTLSEKLLAIDGINEPENRYTAEDGTVAMLTYVMNGGANDIRNEDIVRSVRATTIPDALASAVPGTKAYVSGDAAYTLDVVTFYSNGMPQVMAFVLSLSFILLLIAFRSIVIPIKAILLNLLSTAAAFGVLVWVFVDGHGADLLGFKPGPIEAFVPVFIFTILFGLSMDYHVFILTRIKEARDRGMSSNDAVARGISITSGTITSAAAIMVVVFSVFVTLELTVIKQLGLGLAVAIFLDATIVRSVLLPATMRLLGDWNWWLPRWLSWLPHVTVEGEIPEAEPAGA
ncbi:MAG TPA: MMPL family transporter [Candidatus Limnocylindrales bacterium]|nr:MMPL family transporter [Candidatus Limnocylindrales bacterium]